jgi:hypothetical protein
MVCEMVQQRQDNPLELVKAYVASGIFPVRLLRLSTAKL